MCTPSSSAVDCTTGPLAESGGQAGEQSTTRSVYISTCSQAPANDVHYSSAHDQLLEWVQRGNAPHSFSLSRPLAPSPTFAPLRCWPATLRRRGRFLSIDPLLTTLDHGQHGDRWAWWGAVERDAGPVGIVRCTRAAPRAAPRRCRYIVVQ